MAVSSYICPTGSGQFSHLRDRQFYSAIPTEMARRKRLYGGASPAKSAIFGASTIIGDFGSRLCEHGIDRGDMRIGMLHLLLSYGIINMRLVDKRGGFAV